jgi:hypothetical protein
MKAQFEHHPIDNPGGNNTVIAWNLHLWELGADPRRPVRVEVAWAVAAPTPTGMPEGPEGAQLDQLADSLAAFMRRRAGAKDALRITGNGRQIHVFYAPATVGWLRRRPVREALAGALARYAEAKGRESVVTFADDPQWTKLLGIFSAHDPKQWHQDRDLLIHMIKQRDVVVAKRPVAHRAHFASREDCREFLQAARKARFKSEGGPKPAAPGDPGQWTGVVVHSEPTLLTWHLHPVVLTVKALAEQHRGVYDGWEAELILRHDPEPLAPPGGRAVG